MGTEVEAAPKEPTPTGDGFQEAPGAPVIAEGIVPSDTPAATSGSGKNITLPSRALQARLSEAKASGMKAALTDLDKRAREAGFASVDAMFSHVVKEPTKPAKPEIPEPPRAPLDRNDRKAMAQYQRDVERYRREAEKAKALADQAHRQARDLQRKLHAREAQSELEKAAMAAGVKDIDYAVSLLKRSLEGKSEAELKVFDEGKFFDNLRTERPYLFGEMVRPATTGTGSSVPTTPPTPGQVEQRTGAAGQVDARKMKPEEYNEYLRRKGINPSYEG